MNRLNDVNTILYSSYIKFIKQWSQHFQSQSQKENRNTIMYQVLVNIILKTVLKYLSNLTLSTVSARMGGNKVMAMSQDLALIN